MNINELPSELEELSLRAKKILCRLEIKCIDEFLSTEDMVMLGVKNCGLTTLNELLDAQELLKSGKPVKWAKHSKQLPDLLKICKATKRKLDILSGQLTKVIKQVENGQNRKY